MSWTMPGGYEIRYQSDIYQDLLPSQLATLVEHLHKTENVLKVDIARYIGVSPATLRNYTGLWRLLERGGLVRPGRGADGRRGVPVIQPVRLAAADRRRSAQGTERAVCQRQADRPLDNGGGRSCATRRYAALSAQVHRGGHGCAALDCYRVGEDVRAIKRDLGQRRAACMFRPQPKVALDFKDAFKNLTKVTKQSRNPVLRTAAQALQEYLQ